LTVTELLERAASCEKCGREHKYRRTGPNSASWAADDGHAYAPVIDVDVVANLRYLVTGHWESPWALPPQTSPSRTAAAAIVNAICGR
jgi:hypothetical protein